MTLKEKFSQKIPWYSKKDNLKKSEECEKIADEHAIGFAEWNSYKYKYLPNKGWFATTYQLEMDIFITSKELLEIYKKEKGL
jgi:hypothetical protein